MDAKEKNMKAGQRHGLILTENLFPGYQIASLLKYRGWQVQVEHDPMRAWSSMYNSPVDIFVVDIDEPDLGGMDLLARFKYLRPISYAVALSRGGPSKSMRLARHLHIDGYFYTNHSGYMLDISRGLAPYFLTLANIDRPAGNMDFPHEKKPTGRESEPLPRHGPCWDDPCPILQTLSPLEHVVL
jgi:CheY-like chemotaxis protein